MSLTNSSSPLSLTPFGAGDLIDRTVRFYRNNFWTYVWIASPPILIGTFVSICWILLGQQIFGTGSKSRGEEELLSILFTSLGNLVIWFFEGVAIFIVMGGASRNFVRHILFTEPISFKETYRNAKSRFGGLLGASLIIILSLNFIGGFIFYFGLTIVILLVLLIVAAFQFSAFLATVLSIVLGIAIVFGFGWIFFWAVSRLAYVPQIMLVEGQSVGAAISRSLVLASGNVKRVYALFIFTVLVTYSALLLLYVPLGWYAYLSGTQIISFYGDAVPVWYIIANQVISQISLILMVPVLMIGLCLLYVDERIRHEGYDIELLAAKNLGEIPAVPQTYSNPLQPALANQSPTEFQKNQSTINSSITTLGLND